jgi:deazaflavin-dependent oxidoreductase (nitroreductase family)
LKEKNHRGVLRFLLRVPVFLYRIGLGRLFDGRFLLLKHIGRKTGRQRETVLEIMRYDEADNRCIVCSGWGEKSQWYKNLQQRPQAAIVVRGRQMKVTAVRLPLSEAEKEISRYARDHPLAYRWIGEMLLGRGAKADDFGAIAKRAPVLALKVAG